MLSKFIAICVFIILGYFIRLLCKKFGIKITIVRLLLIWGLGFVLLYPALSSTTKESLTGIHLILLIIGISLCSISTAIFFFYMFSFKKFGGLFAGDKVAEEVVLIDKAKNAKASEQDTDQLGGDKMFCYKCGKEIRKDSTFCYACGSKTAK